MGGVGVMIGNLPARSRFRTPLSPTYAKRHCAGGGRSSGKREMAGTGHVMSFMVLDELRYLNSQALLSHALGWKKRGGGRTPDSGAETRNAWSEAVHPCGWEL